MEYINSYGYNQRSHFYAKRRKRRRKIIMRRIFLFFITTCVTAGAIYAVVAFCGLLNSADYDIGFIPTPYGKNVSKKVLKAEELQIPDWIDEQIIHKHNTARSGIKLM